jgi:hypothetical protein
MKDAEPMNLSSLDPARDPDRWFAIMEATRVRVEAAMLERGAPPDVLAVVGGWARPILAYAALALVVLGAALGAARGSAPPRVIRATDAQRLAALSAGFADGHVPSGAEIAAAVRVRGTR